MEIQQVTDAFAQIVAENTTLKGKLASAQKAAGAAQKKAQEIEAAAKEAAIATVTGYGAGIYETAQAGASLRDFGEHTFRVAAIEAVRRGDNAGISGADELESRIFDETEEVTDLVEVRTSGARYLIAWDASQFARVLDQLGRAR